MARVRVKPLREERVEQARRICKGCIYNHETQCFYVCTRSESDTIRPSERPMYMLIRDGVCGKRIDWKQLNEFKEWLDSKAEVA